MNEERELPPVVPPVDGGNEGNDGFDAEAAARLEREIIQGQLKNIQEAPGEPGYLPGFLQSVAQKFKSGGYGDKPADEQRTFFEEQRASVSFGSSDTPEITFEMIAPYLSQGK